MKKIKIAMFMDNFYPGVDGVISVMDNYARALKNKFEIIMVVPDFNNSYDIDKTLPYKVIRVKSININFVNYHLALPKLDFSLEKKLNKENIDLIHIHSPFTMGEYAIKYAKKHNIKIVSTMHSQFKKDFLKFIKSDKIATKMTLKLMKVFNESDECWAVNKGIADLFVSYGYKKIPKVVPNGTNMFPIRYKTKSINEINKQYSLNKDEKILLFVGRINLLKNELFIVDVLNELKKLNYNYKMLFVGNGVNINELKAKINKYNLNNNVIFCGEVHNREMLAKLYLRSDLFIFPSKYDASSIVQIEAASQGTPTIFIKGTITSSNIVDNINGYLEEENSKVFAKRIISILNNKKDYNNVCKNVTKDIYISYDKLSDKISKEYIRIINS